MQAQGSDDDPVPEDDEDYSQEGEEADEDHFIKEEGEPEVIVIHEAPVPQQVPQPQRAGGRIAFADMEGGQPTAKEDRFIRDLETRVKQAGEE